jgi:hypothetical protein
MNHLSRKSRLLVFSPPSIFPKKSLARLGNDVTIRFPAKSEADLKPREIGAISESEHLPKPKSCTELKLNK